MDMHAISFSMSLFNKKYSPVWRGGWMCVEAILWTTDLSQKKTLTKYLSEKAYQVSTLNFGAHFFFFS